MVRVVCGDAQMASANPSMIPGVVWHARLGVARGEIRDCTRWGTTIQALYKDQKDEALHQRAIERLARKLNRPIAPVKLAYEDAYARLKGDSKVTKFLGVLATRRARDALLRAPT
jgi:hypothetical protein